LDLFTGIGGITLALSDYVRPVCYCEIEPYAQSVLKTRIKAGDLPDAPIWDDVRTLDGHQFRGVVDIITAGFPCQDISVAGKGEGLEGKRSGLFFEIMRLAEEIQPSFIFLENVPAIRTRGLDVVGKELANLGYDCRYGALSAYDVGAPHKRERWFLLAHARRDRRGSWSYENIQSKGEEPIRKDSDNACREGPGRYSMAHATGERVQGLWAGGQQEPDTHGQERLPMRQSQRPFITDWKIEPDVGRVVDGLPARVDRIRCLGNAVVPAQVCEAFERLGGVKK